MSLASSGVATGGGGGGGGGGAPPPTPPGTTHEIHANPKTFFWGEGGRPGSMSDGIRIDYLITYIMLLLLSFNEIKILAGGK